MVSFSWPGKFGNLSGDTATEVTELNPEQAEEILQNLAEVFSQQQYLARARHVVYPPERLDHGLSDDSQPNLEARYRALVEQIPAVVFMAYLDRGIGEAYVSPQIEAALGFSQEEWLEDPVRWYSHIHPDDKARWSTEAAEMFLTGNPLRSAYRVVSRDGRVIWFHCEAKMIRKDNGDPWFIHGVGFDISDLKRTEEALQEERNVVTAILNTVGALVVVLDIDGRIVRFNRACEQTTGYSFAAVKGKFIWDLFLVPEDVERFKAALYKTHTEERTQEYESQWQSRSGNLRTIAWSTTLLPGAVEAAPCLIVSGVDITERKHLEKAILEISAREQRRIGQDLHDGLGQHLTGIAFMTKVQEQKLIEKEMPEAEDAAKIVSLVNEAIHKTRELARGLLPVVSDAQGLMSALQQLAGEVEHLFHVSCRFQCFSPVLIYDDAVATHLYYISREAVNNAIKHGQPTQIVIRLAATEDHGVLTIQDDGCGIGIRDEGNNNKGMGLQLMNYRARMIGGSMEISRATPRGTLVTCLFPETNTRGNDGSIRT